MQSSSETYRKPRRGRPRTRESPPEQISSLDTALQLLSLISGYDGQLGIAQIARMSGEKENKLQRYLTTLKNRGFLVQSEATGLYDVGPQAFALGFWALRRYDPTERIRTAVHQLAETTGFTSNLYVWTLMGPTLVFHQDGVYGTPFVLKLGAVLPLCHSATGTVLFSLLPESRTREVLRREVEIAAAEGRDLPMQYLLNERKKIHPFKVYWSNRALVNGSVAVLPIVEPISDLTCAITCVLPKGFESSTSKQNVQKVIEDISTELQKDLIGYQSPTRFSTSE